MSRIIRGEGAPSVVPKEVHDAKARAKDMVAEAKTEAQAILARAKVEAETVREEARQAGLEQAKLDAAALLAATERTRQARLSSSDNDLVTLALAAAERIVGRALDLDPSVAASAVQAALAHAPQTQAVTVEVNPRDAEAARTLGGVRVVENPSIARGGCLVKTEIGTVDATLQTQLDRLKQALRTRR